MHSYLKESKEGANVSGAINVRYILRDTFCLILLINLETNNKPVAKSDKAPIEDLPVRLTVNVTDKAVIPRKKTIDALNSLKSFTEVGENVRWIVDGTILMITIDFARGRKISETTGAGSWAPLATTGPPVKLGESNIWVKVLLEYQGGGIWPAVRSPQSLTAVSEDTTPQRNVSCTLEYSISRSAEHRSPSPVPCAEISRMGDNVLLDLRDSPMVRLCINISGKCGIVTFTNKILQDIGIYTRIECHNSTLPPICSQRDKSKRINADLYLEYDGEETLVIAFDISQNNGSVNNNKTLLISDVMNVNVENRCVVSFTASRPLREIPSSVDVYYSVRRYLASKSNPLASLKMPNVRTAVANDLRQCLETRELKNLIWEAVRRYVIEDYMPIEQSSSSLSTSVDEIY